MEQEVWKDVVGYEQYYEVSNFGRVKRKSFALTMKNGTTRKYDARLCKPSYSKTSVAVSIFGNLKSIPQLVMEAFCGEKGKHPFIYHKDKDITNNRLDNLTYTYEKIVFDNDESLSEKEYLMKCYDVSRNGVITRKVDGKVLTPTKDHKGYLRIRLKSPRYSSNEDKRKPYRVHRLVAMFYLDDYSDKLQVNHKNGIKTDNRVENLEMVTNKQNVIHAWSVLDSSSRREKLSKSLRNFHLSKRIQQEKRTPTLF